VVAMSSEKTKGTLMAMLGVVSVAWVLVIGATYVFFVIVRPLGPPLTESRLVPSSILKILLTIGLAASWFVVMFAISWLYLRFYRTPKQAS
jgi:hypothetical protein